MNLKRFVVCSTIRLKLFEKNIFELDYRCANFFLHFSCSFKITCILLRQVITFKKIVVLAAKFTILISWSPSCIPLILLSALMKLASTSAAILYNSMESRHPWQTHIRVKGSVGDRFILISDSI